MGDHSGPAAGSPPGAGSTLICGTVGVHQASSQPLFALLPEVVVFGRDDPGAEDLELTVRLLGREARASAPGSQTMLARLGDVLLLHMVRRWLEDQNTGHLNWPGALGDPKIGTALSAMQADPSVDWTVDALARRAHLSRSRFAEQFTARVGQAPNDLLDELATHPGRTPAARGPQHPGGKTECRLQL